MPDETPSAAVASAPRVRNTKPISETDKQRLFDLFARKDQDGKPLTLDAIVQEMGGVVERSTIGRYRQTWEAQQEDKARAKDAVLVNDPIEVLEGLLRDAPGVGPTKSQWLLRMVATNPSIVHNPIELARKIMDHCGIKLSVAQDIAHNVSSAAAEAAGIPMPPPMPPSMVGYGGYPVQPQSYPPPWGQPAYSQQPQPYPPPWGQPFNPYAPPWQQPAPPPKPLDAEDVAKIVRGALDERAAAQPQYAPVAVPGVQYEEFQEPVLVNGQPALDGAGQPVMRWIRRPIGVQTTGQQGFAQSVREMRELGILPTQSPLLEKLADGQRTLSEALARIAQGGAGNQRDPELSAKLDLLTGQNAEIMAESRAEKARREEAEKWQAKMEAKDAELRRLTSDVATASAGMPADAAIVKDAVKAASEMGKTLQTNGDRRLTGLQNIAAGILLGQPQAKPVPHSDAEIESFVEHMESAPTPATPPNGVAPRPTHASATEGGAAHG